MDFGEIGWGGVGWIGLVQDRDKWRTLVNAVINLWVPRNAGKFSSGCTTGGLLSSICICILYLLQVQEIQIKWI
jgi:hypothetical protein